MMLDEAKHRRLRLENLTQVAQLSAVCRENQLHHEIRPHVPRTKAINAFVGGKTKLRAKLLKAAHKRGRLFFVL